MHRLEPVSADFLSRAPVRSAAERDMRIGAAQLFTTLEDPRAWQEFFPLIRTVEWTSPYPLGAGATRVVVLLGGVRLEEVFWSWEPGHRMGFAITATNTALLRALAETYEITPLGADACRLRWAMALALNGRMRRAEPSLAPILWRAQQWLLKRLERVAERHANR